MIKSDLICTREFTVIKHSKAEVSDKKPVYSVSLKTSTVKENETVMVLNIKSNSEEICTQFPLNEQFVVSFRNPQQRL